MTTIPLPTSKSYSGVLIRAVLIKLTWVLLRAKNKINILARNSISNPWNGQTPPKRMHPSSPTCAKNCLGFAWFMPCQGVLQRTTFCKACLIAQWRNRIVRQVARNIAFCTSASEDSGNRAEVNFFFDFWISIPVY